MHIWYTSENEEGSEEHDRGSTGQFRISGTKKSANSERKLRVQLGIRDKVAASATAPASTTFEPVIYYSSCRDACHIIDIIFA